MNISKLSKSERIRRLNPPQGKVRVVLDTDTYNEVDDQFALSYAVKSREKIQLDAIYAAPFFNNRAKSTEDGMNQSYDEIINILNILEVSDKSMVYHGSKNYLTDPNTPQFSEAAYDLVERAMNCKDELLYVVSIGAITNIASAILIEPKIVDKIVIIWLGGQAFFWPDTKEFNLKQDIFAARKVFDCGVPLIHIPCMGVTTHLSTTMPELDHYLMGKSKIGSYLTNIVREQIGDYFGASRVLWDVSAIAWIINSEWVPTSLVSSPIVTDQCTWSFDNRRHLIRSATYMKRDNIYADLFRKLVE